MEHTIACGDCGHVFDDFDAANAMTAEGTLELACPECGSFKRAISGTLIDNIDISDEIER
jgi:hypothetical protein